MDGTIHRGEIIYKDDKAVIFSTKDNQLIYLLNSEIMSIKDLGWQKKK
jgi:hypothetical protein